MNTTGPADKGPVEARTSRSGRALKAPKVYAPDPTASATGKRPTRKKAAIVCVKCHRGNSPNTNMIVFCDGCDATWHQRCHDPPIDDQVVLEKDSTWLCRSCSPVQRSTPARPAKAKKVKRIHPRLQSGPRLEVPGGELPVDKRRAYLSRLSHAELVEIAVEVSVNNPQVPMFPSNMAELPTSQFVATQTSPDPSAAKSKKRKREQTEPSRAVKRTRTTTAGMSKGKARRARSAPASATALTPGLPSEGDLAHQRALRQCLHPYDVPFRGNPSKEPSTVDSSEAPSVTDRDSSPALSEPRDLSPPADFSEQELPEVESSSDAFEPVIDPRYEHRVYPKSGHGFTASSNPADLDILRERTDYETFSHSLHGPATDLESFQAAQDAAAITESVPPKSSKSSKSRSSKSAPPKSAPPKSRSKSGSSKPGSSKSTSSNPAPPKSRSSKSAPPNSPSSESALRPAASKSRSSKSGASKSRVSKSTPANQEPPRRSQRRRN
ncbi:hypothetical protein N7493_009601 [Penicillium malachiteum]|uniref:PHD-type domain-containing protein n=1 Tax=Penicillium malachiteum TaxID=1324776 RepID=A0AAD6HET3_9EURO|nr:hypothetical protein N7493_009601 [Penicillium malachiteum]